MQHAYTYIELRNASTLIYPETKRILSMKYVFTFFLLFHVHILSHVNKYYINSQNIRTMNSITCDKKALIFNIF